MASYAQLHRAGALPAAGRAALGQIPGRKGILQRIFEEMDLPGNVIRNVLSGRVGGAARNVADIATLLTGARLIPYVGKHLGLSRPEDRPSWGFWGDIATDPPTWVTFGGAGGAKALSKAALKGASQRTLAKMATGLMTGAGRKLLKGQAKALVPKLAKRTPRAMAWMAKRFGPGMPERFAQHIILKGSRRLGLPGIAKSAQYAGRVGAKAGAAGALAGRMLRPGGIGLGIPFRDPIATLLPGRDVLKALPPVWAAGKVGAPIAEKVKDIFRPLWRIGPEGQRIVRSYQNEAAQAIPRAREALERIFKGVSPEMAEDITTAISKFDPRETGAGVNSIKKLFSKYAASADDLKSVKKAVKGWQDEAGRMLGREKELGLLTGSKIKPGDYMPLQWTQEYADEVRKAALEGDLGRVYGSRGAGIKSPFHKKRGYETLEEFTAAGHRAELDARRLALLRMRSHHEVVANAVLRRRANSLLGIKPKKITELARIKAGLDIPAERVAKLQKGMRFSSQIDADDVLVGAKRKGKDLGEVTITKIGDTWEVQKLKGDHKTRAALFYAAQEEAAKKGATLSLAEHLRLPRAPKLDALVDKGFAQWFKVGKAGRLARRKGIWKALAQYNQRLFKPWVTTGVGPLINVKFITRNLLSGVFQGATDEDIALAGLKHFRPMVDGVISKVADAIGYDFKGGVVSRLLRGVTKGIKVGTYSGDEFLDLARRHGAIETGFAAKELGVGAGAVAPRAGVQAALAKIPAAVGIKPRLAQRVMTYSENAMRLNGYMTLIKKGIDPEEAARRVTAAFIDYRGGTATERAIRDIFPFAKFTIEQTPRTIAAIARRPVLTQPWRALAGQKTEGPLPPWMEARPVIGLGRGPRGPRIMHQFGTPIEDLERLGTGEGFGRTLEQGLIGSVSPPLKMLYQLAAGREPFTGREIHKMRRLPAPTGWLPGPIQRAIGAEKVTTKEGYKYVKGPWQLAMAIRESPPTVQFRMFDKAFDENTGTISKVVNLLTGMRIVEVDKEYELKRRIRDYLLSKVQQGEVGEFAKFFATGDTSPELAAIVKQYYAIGKKRAKAQR